MTWKVEFIPDADKDLSKLDGSVRKQVLIGIEKVRQSPLSDGYGKPLGNLAGVDLAGLYKVKFKKSGIRVVYKPIMTDNVMKIIIISARADNKVYEDAFKRRKKYDM